MFCFNFCEGYVVIFGLIFISEYKLEVLTLDMNSFFMRVLKIVFFFGILMVFYLE